MLGVTIFEFDRKFNRVLKETRDSHPHLRTAERGNMMSDVRRLAQVVLSIWFAAATSFFQACVPPASNAGYQGTVQSASSVGNSSLPAGSLNANSGVVNVSTASTSSDESFDTTGYSQDSSKSKALTSYLQQHRLPLVGAQVMENRSGNRAVVLYGFVATQFGKSDAANKARSFLKDSNLTVANRINVRPELLSSSGSTEYSGSASSSSAPGNSAPNLQDYTDQQNAIQQYEQQQNPLPQYQMPQQNTTLTTMLPLLAIAGMLALGSFGGGSFGGGTGFGGFGVGPGGYPPGYPGPGYPGGYPGYPGPAPYSPYPGYGSPFSPYP